MSDLSLPARLGRYELLAPVAAGGMAQVYAGRVVGEAGPRLVAVKVMHEELLDEDRFVSMFMDEARVAAHVSHSNVVGVLDLGRTPRGVPYLVMDLVLGASLSQLLKAHQEQGQPPLPVALSVEIAAQTAEGLHAAHEARDALGTALEIVHRDVSPQNILVGLDGHARITDFGVARAVARITRTESGEVKGKARYFSPEQAHGRSVDRRADLWALGVVLWEMLALKPLFSGRTMAEVLRAVASQPLPDVRQHRPEVPIELVEVLAQLLERDPERRIATGAAAAEALRDAAKRTGLITSPREMRHEVSTRAGTTITALVDQMRARGGIEVTLPRLDEPIDAEAFDDEATTVDPELVKRLGVRDHDTGAMSRVSLTPRPSAPFALPSPAAIDRVVAPGAAPVSAPLAPRGGVLTLPLGAVVPANLPPPAPQAPRMAPSGVAALTMPMPTQSPQLAPPESAPPFATNAVGVVGSGVGTARCPRCGRDVDPATLSFTTEGQQACRSCQAAVSIAEADRGAVTSLAGMGYGTLLAGLLTLCVVWIPYASLVPGVLALAGATAYFVALSRSPDARRRMGWQLPASMAAAVVGLVLGLAVSAFALLVAIGLAWAH